MLPFNQIGTFLGTLPLEHKPVGFLGIPYDATTSFRSGAKMGPNAIREASIMLTDGEHPLFHKNPVEYVTDLTNATIDYVNPTNFLIDLEETVNCLYKQYKNLLFAGGDHLSTLGILRGLKRHYKDFYLIHFDAHCDTWKSNGKEKYGHGTWLYNAIEEQLVNPKQVIQIGIRSPVDKETQEYLPNLGGKVISARKAMSTPTDVLYDLTCYNIPNDAPIYVSFDIDVCDPSFAPGTGTPEIGGLSTIKALEFLECFHNRNLIGMDVMEVNPAYDNNQITALAAATLLWTYASMLNF